MRRGSSHVAIDEGGVVRAWNRSAERVFGYREEQAIGFLLEDLVIPPKHREAHRRGIEAFVRTGRGRGVDAPVEVQLDGPTARRCPWPSPSGRRAPQPGTCSTPWGPT